MCRILVWLQLILDKLGKGFLNNLIYKTMMVLYKMGIKLASSVEEGAQTNVYLSVSDEVASISGKYFGNSKEETPF